MFRGLLSLLEKVFRPQRPSAEQHMAAAQHELELLREQFILFLKEEREDVLRKMAQIGGPAPSEVSFGGNVSSAEEPDWLI